MCGKSAPWQARLGAPPPTAPGHKSGPLSSTFADAARAPDQRRRDPRRGPAGAAARAGRARRTSSWPSSRPTATARRRRARSRRAGRCGSARSTSATARSATRPTARPSTACGSRRSGWSRASSPTSSCRASTTAPTSATTSRTPAPSRRRSRASCSACPAIAVSQQSPAREMDFRLGDALRLRHRGGVRRAASSTELDDVPLPEGTLLNINVPAGEPTASRSARLGKRIYRDELELVDERRRTGARFRIYGDSTRARRRGGHRPRGRRRGPDRGDAAALRPDRPRTGMDALARVRPGAAARARGGGGRE